MILIEEVIVPMADPIKEESKEEETFFAKLKEKAGDTEEHLALLSTFVRLGVLIWSGGILTLNYVTIPGLAQRKSIQLSLPACLPAFWLLMAYKQPKSLVMAFTMKMKDGGAGITKADIEKLIEKAAQTAPAQVIRVEQAPLKITTTSVESDDTYKM